MKNNGDTICAIASHPGQGGVGVVRISGTLAGALSQKMFAKKMQARYAHYGAFFDATGNEIDRGIAIYYPAPHSFTGEDVLEFQGHGGVLVLRSIIDAAVALGARIANPGEFSERAFLNGKMDLVQAEAIFDLINAGSSEAQQAALRSLSGEFSAKIEALVAAMIEVRVALEAMIDFGDEADDQNGEYPLAEKIGEILKNLENIIQSAGQGAILKDGLRVAIIGKPNAGKSSLLNVLTKKPSAIVSATPGTTRDIVSEKIHIKGMPIHLADTAGIRQSDDAVEREGVRRAGVQMEDADAILLVYDTTAGLDMSILPKFRDRKKIILVENKIDLSAKKPRMVREKNGNIHLSVSLKKGFGVDFLTDALVEAAGLKPNVETDFLARTRHLNALKSAREALLSAREQIDKNAEELVAEELRSAQNHLGKITGAVSADELLGEIFSTFCIGK